MNVVHLARLPAPRALFDGGHRIGCARLSFNSRPTRDRTKRGCSLLKGKRLMAVNIIEETADVLMEYEKIPIAFRVESRFRAELCEKGLGGIKLVEEPVTPFIKDYDGFETEKPAQWSKRWDISSWGIISAFEGEKRIGGAAVAWNTPGILMLEDRPDLACLWDLRVHPDFRQQGIGKRLFARALEWARQRQCRRFKVETQNINVPACRFYAAQGCELGAINRYAYDEELDEIQLLWYRNL